jgi:hypothetical protein
MGKVGIGLKTKRVALLQLRDIQRQSEALSDCFGNPYTNLFGMNMCHADEGAVFLLVAQKCPISSNAMAVL